MPIYRAPASIGAGGGVTVRKNAGADLGTRPRINFAEGGGITLTVADDGGSNEVDVTIKAGAPGTAYTLTGVDTDRVINTDATTLNELLNVVGTLIQDLGLG